MPLPTGGTDQWPPLDIKPYIDQADAAMAWWSGRIDELRKNSSADGTTGRRRFWQRRNTSDATKATNQLHAPLAADIAAVSADLLFGDGFDLTTSDTDAQATLENLVENMGLINLLAEGAELTSASGGVYLRAAWDKALAQHALSEVYAQNQAVPDFRYGRLTGVTLWKEVHVENGDYWRLMERHEPGRVLSGLYVGGVDTIGDPRPLQELPQTAGILPEIVLTGRLKGRMLVNYVPNVRPNRPLPYKPLGRADWLGSEGFLDALDEIYTSLVRDVRLAQAHIVVPEEWLKATGTRPGETKTLDMDTEAFTALNMADTREQKIDLYQPDIRVTQHVEAALALTERIVSAAGYSPQTFGLNIEGRADSGTALRVRQGKTDKTVGKKQRYWEPEIRSHTQLLLDIGAEIFGTPTVDDPTKDPIQVGWPELEQAPEDKATWIKTLREARAVSVRTAVKLAQPDLEENDVDAEVELIEAENQVPDPFSLGVEPDPTPVPDPDVEPDPDPVE